jgi:two-component system phosphate regulon sensor histidine kinase PhoR
MNIKFARNLEVNSWVIKARWLYTFGIGFLGVITKFIGSYDLPYLLTLSLVIFASFVNSIFTYALKRLKNNGTEVGFWLLSFWQVAFELLIFSAVFYIAGGLSSITAVFFVLPIFLTAILFGPKGSIVSALFSGFFIGIVVYFEYASKMFPHLLRYGELTYEYANPRIAFVQVISYFIFYIIVGIYLGFISRLLFQKEKMLEQNADQLTKETLLRKKEMENTKEIKDKSIAIIANLSDPIIVLDEDHRFYLFNPAAQEILGVGIPDLKKKILDGKKKSSEKYSLENYRSLIKIKFKVKQITEERIHDISVEEVSLNHLGEDRVYKVITSKVTGDHGEYYGVMKIFYDLTREKRIDRMKSEFISVAAHQLRTPLSAIKWVVDMVVKGDAGKINKEQADLLTKAYKSNERMIRLVDDLLNVSRIEEGRFGYNFARYKFDEIINIAIDDIKTKADKKGVAILLDVEPSIPEIEVDRDRILMVLENLLDNAVKYTPAGGKIQLKAKAVLSELEVRVKDDGIGIPEKDQAKLFSKFFRAENVVRMETEGTGLGLFIAKNIIEKHHGRLGYNSRENEGTEFWFSIPMNNHN